MNDFSDVLNNAAILKQDYGKTPTEIALHRKRKKLAQTELGSETEETDKLKLEEEEK